jgi:hypothetical protein
MCFAWQSVGVTAASSEIEEVPDLVIGSILGIEGFENVHPA